MSETQLTANRQKLKDRADSADSERRIQALQMQSKAHEAVLEARAHMYPGTSRQRRRAAAGKAGVFKFPGVWPGLLPRDELAKKCIRKAPEGMTRRDWRNQLRKEGKLGRLPVAAK